MVDSHSVAVETAYEEELVGRERIDKDPPDDERVVVKPDARGGYVVEKFGASVHFTRPQWENLLEAVEVADREVERLDQEAEKVNPDTLEGTSSKTAEKNPTAAKSGK